MNLTILISTIDSGILNIKEILLPQRDDLSYIISHQFTSEDHKVIPPELNRKDILVDQIPGRGLSKSRNNAIKKAKGDICIVADDDVQYTNTYIDIIKEIYTNNDVDIACFKTFKEEGKVDYKKYPKREVQIKNIAEHTPSSIEITFRLDSLKKENTFFDEQFGLGSWLIGGEEKLFIHDCINSGLLVKFFPHYIVRHPDDCTIISLPKYHKRKNNVRGAMDMRINGYITFFKALPKTIILLSDLLKQGKNPLSFFIEYLNGVFYIFRNRTRN